MHSVARERKKRFHEFVNIECILMEFRVEKLFPWNLYFCHDELIRQHGFVLSDYILYIPSNGRGTGRKIYRIFDLFSIPLHSHVCIHPDDRMYFIYLFLNLFVI